MSGVFLQRKQILRAKIDKDMPKTTTVGWTPVNRETK